MAVQKLWLGPQQSKRFAYIAALFEIRRFVDRHHRQPAHPDRCCLHDTNSISRCISEFARTPSKLVRLLPLTAY
jgi:hypothetical protein